MVNLKNKTEKKFFERLDEDEPVAAIVGLIFVSIVLGICFGGLLVAVFVIEFTGVPQMVLFGIMLLLIVIILLFSVKIIAKKLEEILLGSANVERIERTDKVTEKTDEHEVDVEAESHHL